MGSSIWRHLGVALCFLAALPAAEFTTYIGDVNDYHVARVAADSAGNTYLAGSRTVGALSEAVVMKLDPTGKIVLFTILSGKGGDAANSLAVDAAGNIYLAGSTSSPDFPLHNAFQSTPGRGFLVKLSADGSQILYSTYFPEAITALAVDAAGGVYVAGTTYLTSFPVTPGLPAGPVSMAPAGITSGAFLTKISADGSHIVYSALFSGATVDCGGGSSCYTGGRNTTGVAVAVDAAGEAYLAGNTNTDDLPTTPGAFLTKGPGAYVAKVNATGSALAYLTYISPTNFIYAPNANPANIAAAIAVDAAGDAFLAGATFDPSLPATAGAYQSTFSGPYQPGVTYPLPPTDAFALKLNPAGTAVVWASYLGGTGVDAAKSVALDANGNVWLSGTTASATFPNKQGWVQSGSDFLAAFNPSGSALIYSARYPNDALSQSLAVDSAGLLHVAGPTGIVGTVAPSGTPLMRIFGIANAAYGPLTGRIVPAELISIYGPHIGPATPVTATATSGFLPTSLGGVQVLVNGVAVPLLYVSDSQINAVAPQAATPNSSLTVQIVSNSVTSPGFPVTVVTADPQVFQNPDSTAAAINQDNTLNSAANPAKAGSIVSIWVTGTGAVYPRPLDGQISTAAQDYECCQVGALVVRSSSFVQVPQPTPAPVVLYAGAAPGMVAGLVQINFQVPPYIDTPSTLGFSVFASGQSSSTVGIYVAP
jgi:uncharacterized protein (TIGR03437 family)